MVDLMKPCVKCGAVDRYKCGNCKKCVQNRNIKRGLLNKPCGKCGAMDRDKHGSCKPCDKGRIQKHYTMVNPLKPCVKCGAVDRYKCGDCRACDRNRKRKLSEVHGYHERNLKRLHKTRRLQFEFSLQTQQKVIEQCQQKST